MRIVIKLCDQLSIMFRTNILEMLQRCTCLNTKTQMMSPLVLDRYFKKAEPKGNRHLPRLLESVNGSALCEDFADCRGELLSNPRESISAVIRQACDH